MSRRHRWGAVGRAKARGRVIEVVVAVGFVHRLLVLKLNLTLVSVGV